MSNLKVNKKIFMENIKLLRKHFGLSKREMAEIMNVSVYSISKIEKGELPVRMSVCTIFALERHFGIKAENLFSALLEKEKTTKFE